MAGKYVLLFLLLSCCLISCKKVIVDYDEHTDVILKDGKLYIPTIKEVYESNSTYSLRVMNLDEGYLPSNIEGTASEHCGEELVTGSEFWFYIFIVLCKFTEFCNFSFNYFCRVDVWFNSGIFID